MRVLLIDYLTLPFLPSLPFSRPLTPQVSLLEVARSTGAASRPSGSISLSSSVTVTRSRTRRMSCRSRSSRERKKSTPFSGECKTLPAQYDLHTPLHFSACNIKKLEMGPGNETGYCILSSSPHYKFQHAILKSWEWGLGVRL